ncbi:hypothetical protein lerEdw1_019629 [Lerista edwardsae]|nr:hypothetical protein lerEdw1_019629 [Lerista edwardsae]
MLEEVESGRAGTLWWKGALGLPLAIQKFSTFASMAEHGAQPSPAWHSGNPSAHPPTLCPLEHVGPGISEQPTLLEQPPPSPDLGDDEDDNEVEPPPDPDVPYPDLAPVVFFCLKQTTSPRNWCIKMVCNPYPLKKNKHNPSHCPF